MRTRLRRDFLTDRRQNLIRMIPEVRERRLARGAPRRDSSENAQSLVDVSVEHAASVSVSMRLPGAVWSEAGLQITSQERHVRATQRVRRATTASCSMVKAFITGTAQGVTDSVKRVTAIMKGRADPHAERQAAQAAQKELGKRGTRKATRDPDQR